MELLAHYLGLLGYISISHYQSQWTMMVSLQVILMYKKDLTD